MYIRNGNQRGAVSLFVVIFTALLVTVVTVGFMQVMLQNQKQTIANDLSQSAYDSALSGIEDAKRVLIKLAECGDDSTGTCGTVKAAISNKCSTNQDAGVATATNGEVVVNATLNQAYSCVKINPQTATIVGKLTNENPSVVLKLKGSKDFNQVKLSWFVKADAPSGTLSPSFPAGIPVATGGLPAQTQWQSTMPPIMRAQYISGKKNVSQLTAAQGTLFLYPTGGVTGTTVGKDFALDTRRASAGVVNPTAVVCDTVFDADVNGICRALITLPESINVDEIGYLQLEAMYNASSYTLQLGNGADNVLFDGVQPEVDATGRASDLFRRVKARITMNDGIPIAYPNAVVNVNNNLCKTFFITDTTGEYSKGSCEPGAQN